MSGYKFNKDQLRFVEEKRGAYEWIKRIFKYLFASAMLAIVYYFIVSLVYSTNTERRLARENKLIEKEYLRLQQKLEVLDNTVKNLQFKDKEIYNQIFKSDPPSHNDGYIGNSGLNDIDTTKDDNIIMQAKMRLARAQMDVERVNNAFSVVNNSFSQLGDSVLFIPSIVPVKDFIVNQTGASLGKKINPFYKTVVSHTGLDLLGATDTEIIATASGRVEIVSRKGKKEGNMVVINHGNGYTTRYLQMGDIIVRQGQKVDKGEVIGRIGVSGMSFTPHLHYEVIFNDQAMEPINYFFADLSPAMYREMLLISANTGQSLD